MAKVGLKPKPSGSRDHVFNNYTVLLPHLIKCPDSDGEKSQRKTTEVALAYPTLLFYTGQRLCPKWL